MSQYRSEARYSADLSYRDGPPPNRWDADRLARERDYRDGGYDDYYAPQAAPPRRARPVAPVYEEERRYYEDDVYGPRGSRVERRYFEEDDYDDPRVRRGQVVPFRPDRPSRPQAPPRPGQLLRRQSSLDTFDRPQRRFDEYSSSRRPPRIDIDVPPEPSPRDNRYRPPHRYPVNDRREYYDEYDDVQVQDPDYYGDDGFREYREREWVRSRRRDSTSRSRSRPRPETVVDDRKTEIEDDHKSVTTVDDAKSVTTKASKKEIVVDTKTEKKEKPYPRRGKTKMPKRLVHTKVLFDLGYTFYEENEKTIIIEKALGPDNIDEIFVKSKEYREKEVSTTKLLEAPPAASTVRSPSPPPAESVRQSRHTVVDEQITTKSLSEAPRAVREWDQMTNKTSDTKRSRRSVRSKSQARSPSPAESIHETVVEKKSIVVDRSPSPVSTHKTSRSRHRSRRRSESVDKTEIFKRRVVTEDDVGFEESATLNIGPLALVRDVRKERSDRQIQAEIDALRAERRDSRRERKNDRSSEVIIERIERSPSRHRRRRKHDSDEEIVERVERIVRSRSPSRRRRHRESEGGTIIVERIERSFSPPRRRRRDSDEGALIIERIDRSRSPSRRRYREKESDLIIERIERSRSPSRRRYRDSDLIVERIARSRSRSSSPGFDRSRGSITIERRGDELVEVRKERRDRSSSRPAPAPSSRLIKGLIYAAT